MPATKYVIELSEQDRSELIEIVKKGKSPARTILRANILLASDRRSGKHMTIAEISKVYHTTPTDDRTEKHIGYVNTSNSPLHRKIPVPIGKMSGSFCFGDTVIS